MTQKLYGCPRDMSLQAYKDFIVSFTQALTDGKRGKESDLTEEEWVSAWLGFWGDKLPQEEKDKLLATN